MRIGPLGIWEVLAIMVVILLVFGPRRLPEMAKGIGQSVREFRKGIRDMKDDFAKDDAPTRAAVVTSVTSPSVLPVSASVAAPEASVAAPEATAAAETTKEPVGAL